MYAGYSTFIYLLPIGPKRKQRKCNEGVAVCDIVHNYNSADANVLMSCLNCPLDVMFQIFYKNWSATYWLWHHTAFQSVPCGFIEINTFWYCQIWIWKLKPITISSYDALNKSKYSGYLQMQRLRSGTGSHNHWIKGNDNIFLSTDFCLYNNTACLFCPKLDYWYNYDNSLKPPNSQLW